MKAKTKRAKRVMDNILIIYIVTSFNNNEKPIVMPFYDYEVAYKCYLHLKSKYDVCCIDTCLVQESYTIYEENNG